MNFTEKVQKYWTADRLKKLTTGHKYVILPTTGAELLRCLGILNADASMSADATRKYIQINHLLAQFRPFLEDLNQRHKTIRILDAGCGSSFLTFLLAWAYRDLWKHPSLIIGIDASKSLIEKNVKNAAILNLSDQVKFNVSPIAGFDWQGELTKHSSETFEDAKAARPQAVVALHACDTATDDAIAMGIKLKSDFIAVAPCCQAELARLWKGFAEANLTHPFSPAFSNPHLRREIAAQITDLMRVLILRSQGYEVTTTEFTMSHATPKNTLILAVRRGNYHAESLQEYKNLVASLNGAEISLATKVSMVPQR